MIQAKLAGYLADPDSRARALSADRHQRRSALCPRHGLFPQARSAEGARRDQQPDQGRAEKSLFLGSAGADLCGDEPAGKRHRALSEIRRSSARCAAVAHLPGGGRNSRPSGRRSPSPRSTISTIALQQENDNTFGWYEAAQAYSQLGNQPMADLSTAERYYSAGAMPMAAQFAKRAEAQIDERLAGLATRQRHSDRRAASRKARSAAIAATRHHETRMADHRGAVRCAGALLALRRDLRIRRRQDCCRSTRRRRKRPCTIISWPIPKSWWT